MLRKEDFCLGICKDTISKHKVDTHNLTKKVKVLESALSQQQLDLVYYDMLPSLTTAAGYSERNNYAASASTSFLNGNPQPLGSNPSYSVSQEKERVTGDITFGWNILDFGI